MKTIQLLLFCCLISSTGWAQQVTTDTVQIPVLTPALSEEDFLFEATIQEEDTKMDEATIQLFFSQMEPAESKPQKMVPMTTEEVAQLQPEEVSQPEEVVTPMPLPNELLEMLQMKSYQEVLVYLNQLKEEGRAMYGRIKTMTAPDKSYLLMVRNGELVAILDKGTGTRTNLKTNQLEPVKNYIGYGVIWFQLY